MNEDIDLLIKDFYGKFANKQVSSEKIAEIKNTYKDDYKTLIKDFYGKFKNESVSDSKIDEIIKAYNIGGTPLGKNQGVPSQSSKGTSKTSSEPFVETTTAQIAENNVKPIILETPKEILKTVNAETSLLRQDKISFDEWIGRKQLNARTGEDITNLRANPEYWDLQGMYDYQTKVGNYTPTDKQLTTFTKPQNPLFSTRSQYYNSDIENNGEVATWSKGSDDKFRLKLGSFNKQTNDMGTIIDTFIKMYPDQVLLDDNGDVIYKDGEVYDKYLSEYITLKENNMSFGEKLDNSWSNFTNQIKRFIPEVQIASTDIWEKVLGDELANNFYLKTKGITLDQVREEAYDRVAQLEEQMKYTSGGFIENIRSGNFTNLLVDIVDAIGGAGATVIPTISTLGGGLPVQMAGMSIYEYNKAKADTLGISVKELYDKGEADLGVPLAISTLASTLEFIGLKSVGNAILKDLSKGFVRNAMVLGMAGNKEGLTELLQGGLEAVNKGVAEGKSETEIANMFTEAIASKEGIERYLKGFVGSLGIVGVGRIVKRIATPKSKAEATQIEQELLDLENDLQNPNISEEMRTSVQEAIDKKLGQLALVIERDTEQFEKLSDKGKREINKINNELTSLQEALNAEGISSTLKQQLEERITKLVEKQQKVIEENTLTEEELATREQNKTKEGGQNALFEQSTGEVLQRQQSEIGETRGERGGVEQIEQGQEITQQSQEKVTPKVKDVVELPSKIEGGLPTNMEFTDEGWKQRVGRELVDVSKTVQNQAQEAFDATNNAVEVVSDTTQVKSPNQTDTIQEEEVETKKLIGTKKELLSPESVTATEFNNMSEKEKLAYGDRERKNGNLKVDEIINDVVKNRNSERVLNTKETAGLLSYKVELENKREDLILKLSKSTSENSTSLRQELDAVNKDLYDLDYTLSVTASEQGSAFSFRQVVVDRNLNIQNEIREIESLRGRPLTKEEKSKYEELEKRYTELQESLILRENQLKDLEAQQVLNSIAQQVNKKTPSQKAKAEANLKKAKDDFRKALKKGSSNLNSGFNPEAIKALGNVIKSYIEVGLVNLNDIVKEFKKDFGSKFVKDNMSLIEDAHKNSLNEITSETNVKVSNSIPSINEEGVLFVPNAFLREEIGKGNTQIEGIIEAVKNSLGTEQTLTDREIRDAITNYGRSNIRTQSQVQKDIKTAKTIGKLLSQIEDLENGIPKAKNAKKSVEINDRVKELRQKVRNLEAQLPLTDEQIQLKEERRTQAKKEYYKKYIADKELRLKNKDFSPKPIPSPVLEDAELIALQKEARAIRNEFEFAKKAHEFENKHWLDKAREYATLTLQGILRDIGVGIDLGTGFIQGVKFTYANILTNPKKVVNLFSVIIKAFASKKFADTMNGKIMNSENFIEAQDLGVAFQLPVTGRNNVDLESIPSATSFIYKFLTEKVIGYVLNRIEGTVPYAKSIELKKNSDKLFRNLNLLDRGANSFNAAINYMRLEVYNAMADDLKRTGESPKTNKANFKEIAKGANTFTLHGDLGGLNQSASFLSLVFFSTRKMIATLKTVNPMYWVMQGIKNPKVTAIRLKQEAKFIGTALGLLVLTKLAYDEKEGYDTNPDFWNILSSDFLKIKIGSTRLSYFANMEGYLVYLSRMMMGVAGLFDSEIENYKSLSSPEMKRMGDVNVPTPFEVSVQFFSNKATPFTGLLLSTLDQSVGREISVEKEVTESLRPMWLSAFSDFQKDMPYLGSISLTALSALGLSSGTYGTPTFLDPNDPKDSKYKELIAEKMGYFKMPEIQNVKKFDPIDNKVSKVSKEDYEIFTQSWNSYWRDAITTNYDKLKNSDLKQFFDFTEKEKELANDYAKASINIPLESLEKLDFTYQGEEQKYKLDKEQQAERNAIMLKEKNRIISEKIISEVGVKNKYKIPLELAKKRVVIEAQKRAEKYARTQIINKYKNLDTKRLDLESR